MNEFCKNCDDRRGENCALPSRLRMVGNAALHGLEELLVVMSPNAIPFGGPGVVTDAMNIAKTGAHRELKSEAVLLCIREHSEPQP